MSVKATSANKSCFSGYNSQLNAVIQQIIDREVDSYAHRYKTALTRAMKEIVQESVRGWHTSSGLGGTTAEILASAVKTESAFIRTTKNKKVIRVTSFFGGDAIDSMGAYFPDAAKWASKYAEYCTMSVGAYIFSLRWDQGILALPERSWARGLDWVNPDFRVSGLGTMQSYCMDQVMKNLASVTLGLVRGRNQSMGAGMKSANRSGASNLVHGKGGGT